MKSINFLLLSILFCSYISATNVDNCAIDTLKNVPLINIIDHNMVDIALKKSISEDRYKSLGYGYIVFVFDINYTGEILEIKSISYINKGLILDKEEEKKIKHYLKKFVRFNVPVFYKGQEKLPISHIYKKQVE